MKVTAYVSHEDCPRHDTGWNSPDHQGRLPAVARAVYKDMLTLFEPLLELHGEPARDEDLRLVHTSRHVAAVRAAAEEAAASGEIVEVDGVRLSAASWEAATAAAGGALVAIDAVLRGDVRNAFFSARPEGRDATADAAGGFGVFNNVAIAARHLVRRCGMARVLAVAWGARPPLALAGLLEGEPGVSFVSVHGGEPADVPGIALAAGSDGAAVEAALREALAGIGPVDFVLLSASFDLLAGDPLGDLAVQPAEVHAITTVLREWADANAGGRLVSVLEGGYDASATGKAVVQHLRALAGLPPA